MSGHGMCHFCEEVEYDCQCTDESIAKHPLNQKDTTKKYLSNRQPKQVKAADGYIPSVMAEFKRLDEKRKWEAYARRYYDAGRE